MPISLPEIEAAAHECAFGRNRIPEPTENQCNAGNYKMGRFDYHGLKIVIEQPRGAYRTGIDQKTGKRWTSRMAAHYGYIGGTKGADGDGVDCFVGFYPQSEHVFVINQNVNGRFDEHKAMLAFPGQESAIRAYNQSYDRDWSGLASIVQLSINQLKWWLKNGDMRRPIKQADLPAEGFETMKRVYWNENNMPLDGRTLDRVLYEMRQSDEDNLLLDSVSLSEILEDAEGVVMLDALVTPFVKLERKMSILQGIMERSASQIKPVAMQISDPFKQSGVVNIAVVYELSDGQTISIYFHNPDVTPQKIAPTDEVISWKWMLNKKDITIVVAPERGRDLDVREVARRILKLAEKNSAAFARANAKRADRMQNIQNLKDEIVTLEGELKSAQNELEVLKIQVGDNAAKREDLHIAVREALSKMGWDGFSDGSVMTMGNFRASVSGNYAGFQVDRLDSDSGTWLEAGFMSLGPDKTAQEVADGIALIVESSKPDDVEAAIASVVSGSGESEETSTDLGYNPDFGDPLITVMAEYKYTENSWNGVRPPLQFTASRSPEKFEKIEGYIKDMAKESGISRLGNVEYGKSEFSRKGVKKQGITHKGVVSLRGDDGEVYVRIVLSFVNDPIAGVITKKTLGAEDAVNSYDKFIGSIYEYATSRKFDKPMPEAMKIIERITGRSSESLDPTSPEINASLPENPEESRRNEVYQALSSLGWDRVDEFMKLVLVGQVSGDEIEFVTGYEGGEWVTTTPDAEVSRFKDGGTAEEVAQQINSSAVSSLNRMNDLLREKYGDQGKLIAAKVFLQSVIDGAKDASDLMNLLDEIDASAKALIDAGKGDEYDELIGKAAEKWAELDQQANG